MSRLRNAGLMTLLVAAFAFAAAALSAGCSEKSATVPAEPSVQGAQAGHAMQEPPSGTGAAKGADVVEQKTCPVMGGVINKKHYADYNGRRIYFCCPACIETFKKDPEKYIRKVDEELAAGKKPA